MSLKRMVLSLPVGALLFTACGIDQTDATAGAGGRTFGGSGGQTAGGSGSTDAGATGGAGGDMFNPGGGGESASAGTGAGDGNGGTGGVEECAGDPYEAKLLPLDMFIMMDKSGSMAGSRWSSVKQAVNDFVSQPVEGHVGVGLGLFPGKEADKSCSSNGQCGDFGPCGGGFLGLGKSCQGECNTAGYANPVVPFQALPAGAAPVQAEMNAASTGGGTPMTPALAGAIQYAQANTAANPTHVTTVVLVSDGNPESCGGGIPAVANAAAQGLTNGVRTFVVGIGDELTSFEQIATAGGTSPALLIDSGTNVTTALQDKLEEIRGSVQCSYTMPEVPDGEIADFDTTNVVFTLEGDPPENAITFGRVDDASQCADGVLAYYFDNPADPTMIHLCPFACEYIEDHLGEIKLTLGCEPPPEPPPPPGPG